MCLRASFYSRLIKHYLKSSVDHSEEDGKGTTKQHLGCVFSMEPCTDKHNFVSVP